MNEWFIIVLNKINIFFFLDIEVKKIYYYITNKFIELFIYY